MNFSAHGHDLVRGGDGVKSSARSLSQGSEEGNRYQVSTFDNFIFRLIGVGIEICKNHVNILISLKFP